MHTTTNAVKNMEGNQVSEQVEQSIPSFVVGADGTLKHATPQENNLGGGEGGSDAPPAPVVPAASATEPPKEAPKETPAVDYTPLFQTLSQRTGREIKGEEDLFATFSKVAELEPLSTMSAFLKKAHDFESKGGELKKFFEIATKDYDSIEGKSALKEKWMLDKADLVKGDKELADMLFEKEYKAKYDLLDVSLDGKDEEEIAEWKRLNDSELKLQQKLLAHESAEAKKSLKTWQSENTTAPQASQGPSPEQIAEQVKLYDENVKATLESFKGIQIPLDEKGTESYTLTLDKADQEKAVEYLKYPNKFLEDLLGIDQNGQVSPAKMLPAIVKLLNAEKIGTILSTVSLERFNKQTLAAKIENPKSATPISTPAPEKPFAQKLAAAYKELRSQS